jgi:hypothetical protein
MWSALKLVPPRPPPCGVEVHEMRPSIHKSRDVIDCAGHSPDSGRPRSTCSSLGLATLVVQHSSAARLAWLDCQSAGCDLSTLRVAASMARIKDPTGPASTLRLACLLVARGASLDASVGKLSRDALSPKISPSTPRCWPAPARPLDQNRLDQAGSPTAAPAAVRKVQNPPQDCGCSLGLPGVSLCRL